MLTPARRRLTTTTAIALVTLSAARGRADVCPAPSFAPAVAGIDAETRRAFLERAFSREVSDIDLWSWSWGGVYTAGTIAQGVLLSLTQDHGKRIDYEVGVVSTGFGALSLTLLPLQLTLPLRSAARSLHGAGGDPCLALARAEQTLRSVDKDQALAVSIVGDIGNVVVNLVFGGILGAYGRWSTAAISVGVGIPIGEANGFTQPHHLRDVLDRYRAGQLDAHATPGPALTWAIVPLVAPGTTGAALAMTW